MAAIVADTHAVLWAILKLEDRLSPAALEAFKEAEQQGDPVYISSISLVETRYLEEKGKPLPGTLNRLHGELNADDASLILIPLTRAVADAFAQIPRDQVPDMPDRIIAATALYLNLPPVTRDHQIQAASITTIW
jgi:PIN domain nuclease of toxin-antitoxin system